MIIDPDALPGCPEQFGSRLAASVASWREAGKRGIWLRLPTALAALAGPAAAQGFDFHGADRGYVTMTRWLPDGPCTLPAGASHQVGVGAIVTNARRDKILTVLERNGPLKGTGVYKMPTGLSDPGEDVVDAAVREVKEETGIDCVPEGVIAIRQMHGATAGKSDLFFVVGCRVSGGEEIAVQQSELEDAKWMPLDEYAAIGFMRSRPLYAKIVDRCVAWARGEVGVMRGERLDSGLGRGEQLLFFL